MFFLALIFTPACHLRSGCRFRFRRTAVTGVMKTALLVVNNARQIFNCQRSRLLRCYMKTSKISFQRFFAEHSPSDFFVLGFCCLMVGLGRFELPTSPLSAVRSNQLSYRPGLIVGGAGRDRTGDLLNANQALSQLSYSPLTRGVALPRATWG